MHIDLYSFLLLNAVIDSAVGISNVKSREDLVMSNTDLSTDPFSAAPFPAKNKGLFPLHLFDI